MPETDLKDTQPHIPLQKTPAESPITEPKKNFPRWLVGICVVALIAIGLLAGYGSGMGRRVAAYNMVVAGQLDEQFQLGMQAYTDGNYELAQKYLDFVITNDPSYPGIVTAYSDLMMKIHSTPTPEFSPTPVVSPTPDLRGAQDIFNTAQQLLNASDWNGAITNLDSLRKSFPTFQTAQVDGMYYMALRQRGVGKIAASCKDANLEGGIYDLTLAEHFVGTGNLAYLRPSIYYRRQLLGPGLVAGAKFFCSGNGPVSQFNGFILPERHQSLGGSHSHAGRTILRSRGILQGCRSIFCGLHGGRPIK